MLPTEITNSCYQRASFAAILCSLLTDTEQELTHEDVKILICQGLQRCSQFGVGDHIEEVLLKRANSFVEQHNTLIEAKQILNQ